MEERGHQYCYKYPRPAVATDCVILGWEDRLKVLLIERGGEPFRGCWALPGGFLEMQEDAETCARRELEEETGIKGVEVEQLHAFSAVRRDPRYRVISIAYYALVAFSACQVRAGDDAAKAQWFPVEAVPELAFDHKEVLQLALERLKQKSLYYPIGLGVLPERFTLSELRRFYEAIRQKTLDAREFGQKILQTGIIEPVQDNQTDPVLFKAGFYRFKPEEYQKSSQAGLGFLL